MDPSPVLLHTGADEDEDPIWGLDPVHPKAEGYEKVVDLLEIEFSKLLESAVGRKRASSASGGGARKKAKYEPPRASWVNGEQVSIWRGDSGQRFWRGRAGGGRRPRGGYRGRGGRRGNG